MTTVSENTTLTGVLKIPLINGGRMEIGPRGILIYPTDSRNANPGIKIDGVGIQGLDQRGTQGTVIYAASGELVQLAGAPLAPYDIQVSASVNGLSITSSAWALKNSDDIITAEFRAKFFAAGSSYPSAVDLSTDSEGGTWVANGTTDLHDGCIDCASVAALYSWTSVAHGRWYYVWRLKNNNGWSEWSDGNPNPTDVTDYIDTQVVTTTGPPANWNVYLYAANQNDHFYVVVDRPTTNGNAISRVRFQIKDANNGAWNLVDANDGNAAITYYDGSAANHVVSHGGARITQLVGNNFGNANVGDMCLLDIRGANNYNTEHCRWSRVSYIHNSGEYFEVDPPIPANVAANDYRCKIVKPPQAWNNNGYLGDETGDGWAELVLPAPDVNAPQFISPMIYAPSGIVTPEARVWFTNLYSTSDDNNTHSSGITGNEVGGGGDTGPVTGGNNWANFADQSIWIPFRGAAPTDVDLSFDGNGALTMFGNSNQAYAAFDSGMSGIILNGRLLPDANNGFLQFRASFDQFTPYYDHNTTYSCCCPIMMWMWPDTGHPDALASSSTKVAPLMFITNSWNNAGNDNFQAGVALMAPGTGWTQPGNNFLEGSTRLTRWDLGNNLTNNSNFSMDVQFGPAKVHSFFGKGWGIHNVWYNSTDGNYNNNFVALAGANDVISQMFPMGGMRLAIGISPGHYSNNTSARLVNFELVTGRFWPDTAGGAGISVFTPAPPQSQVVIFKYRGA